MVYDYEVYLVKYSYNIVKVYQTHSTVCELHKMTIMHADIGSVGDGDQ